eukprot:1143243-Ditylum_brightwellii.AAC.1
MTQPTQDNNKYSKLNPPQLQSPTPHLDDAITKILAFNPLLQRTPQQSNLDKWHQQGQDEDTTPNISLEFTENKRQDEHGHIPTMEPNQINNNTNQNQTLHSIKSQLFLLHAKILDIENKTKQDLNKMI